MITMLCWLAFALGSPICLFNFYLSFLRYPLYRLCGVTKESYRSYSGIPLFGSMLVALSLIGLYRIPIVAPFAITFICLDTGGILWFFIMMTWMVIYRLLFGEGKT